MISYNNGEGTCLRMKITCAVLRHAHLSACMLACCPIRSLLLGLGIKVDARPCGTFYPSVFTAVNSPATPSNPKPSFLQRTRRLGMGLSSVPEEYRTSLRSSKDGFVSQSALKQKAALTPASSYPPAARNYLNHTQPT